MGHIGQIPIVEADEPLRAVIEKNKGRAFIYCGTRNAECGMEEEYAEKIEDEYRSRGKEFLISNNGDGCAVFGVHTHWLVPAECADPIAWIRRHLKPLVAETGIFEELRAEADAKAAERAKLMEGNVFFHTGDLGDIIAALPAIRALGGGYLILGNRHGRGGRELMSPERFAVIEPLLSAQSYITGVELRDDAPGECGMRNAECGMQEGKSIVTHDFTRFREHAPPQARDGDRLLHGGAGYNLATWQADYFGVKDVDLSPWLAVGGNAECGMRNAESQAIANEARGKAIFARTERYHNPKFDWAEIVRGNSPALFVGLEDEWENFRAVVGNNEPRWSASDEGLRRDASDFVGAEVRYRPTANFLELAQLIAASKLFVGNQTSTFWIAAGLGHPLIQETDQWNLNSIVERHNAEYRM